MKICILGDIFCGGDMNDRNVPELSTPLREWLSGHDLRLGNLEGVFIDSYRTPPKDCVLFAHPERVAVLKELQMDCVNLANNHFHDQGIDGMVQTLSLLDENGIGHVGGGLDLEQARRPWIAEIKGVKIGVLGYCAYEPGHMMNLCFAGPDTPGVVRLDDENWRDDVKALRDKVDRIVVLIHWGKEHTWLPLAHDVKLAKRMADAGVDAVIGGHPHRLQGCFMRGGTPVAMSLGNGLFPNFLMVSPSTMSYDPKLRQECRKSTRFYYGPKVPTLKKWSWTCRASLGVSLEQAARGFSMKTRILWQDDSHSRLKFLSGPLGAGWKLWTLLLGAVIRIPGYRWFEKLCRLLGKPVTLITKLRIAAQSEGIGSFVKRQFGRICSRSSSRKKN